MSPFQRKRFPPTGFGLTRLTLNGLLFFFGISVLTALLLETGVLMIGSPVPCLLNSETTVTLFIALTGVRLTLQELSQNTVPYLIYESGFSPVSELGLVLKKGERVWRVRVGNAGTGMAIVEDVQCLTRHQNLSVASYIQRIGKKGLREGIDFRLESISKGYALPVQKSFPLAEIKSDRLGDWMDLSLRIGYRNLFGEQGEKIIRLAPKK